jgi:hypothetical protein
MTAQPHPVRISLDGWFQPVTLPIESYREFASRLDAALADLEKRHGITASPKDDRRGPHGAHSR